MNQVETENATLVANLENSVSRFEAEAANVTINNDADYQSASEMTKQIKTLMKQVKDYWEPLRTKAKAVYDDVLSQKKQMMDPLEKAEKILKGKLGGYVLQKQEEERKNQEALRRLAMKEAESKIDEAIALDSNGDTEGAAYAFAEAEAMESLSITGGCGNFDKPKASGVSTSKTYRISKIDLSLVPVTFGGVVIRPVDEKAVLSLIKQSKGAIDIPGIEFVEDVVVSVRT